jgi:hypothetical protein
MTLILPMIGSGYIASGGGGETTIYSVTDTEGFATHNSSSISLTAAFGTAYADREIWVVVPTMQGTGSTETNTVTIGGNSMTKVFETAVVSFASATAVSYWKYKDDGALGTSGTVVVNFDDDQVHSGVLVFTVAGEAELLDSYSDTTTGATPTSGTIDTSENGWAFYCAASQNSTSGLALGFGNRGSFDMGSNEWVVYGFNSPEDNGTVTISPALNDGTSNRTISGISTTGA